MNPGDRTRSSNQGKINEEVPLNYLDVRDAVDVASAGAQRVFKRSPYGGKVNYGIHTES